jgi:hypothetical protein
MSDLQHEQCRHELQLLVFEHRHPWTWSFACRFRAFFFETKEDHQMDMGKRKARKTAWTAAGLILAAAGAPALAQGSETAFTIQGRLDQSGAPISGAHDFEVNLHDTPEPEPGSLVDSRKICGIAVDEGLFSFQVDFGQIFGASPYFVELGIAPAGPCDDTVAFTHLTPLQQLTAAPNSLFSLEALDSATVGGRPPTDFLLRTGGTLSGNLTITASLCLAGVCRSSWLWNLGGSGVLSYQGGRVGIGTSSPTEALGVTGNIRASGTICGSAGCVGDATGGDGHSLDAADGSPTNVVYVDNSGNVGVGTQTPTQKLSVTGNVNASGTICDAGGCIGSAAWANITGKPTEFPPTGIRNGDFRTFGRLTVDGPTDLNQDLRVDVNGTDSPQLVLGPSGLISMQTFYQDKGRILLSEYDTAASAARNAIQLDANGGGELTVFDGEATATPNTINKTIFMDGKVGLTGGQLVVRDGLRGDNLIELRGYDPTELDLATIRVKGALVVQADGGPGGYIRAGQLLLSDYLYLATVSGAPPAADCNETAERGRAKFDPAAGRLYLCANSGWIQK